MVAKKYLLGSQDFDEVKNKGKVYQSESFGISYLKRKDDDNPKYGFIISTKVCPLAVKRNIIKRAISEAVRHSLYESKNGYNIVFMAKREGIRKSTDELMKEVRAALISAKLIK